MNFNDDIPEIPLGLSKQEYIEFARQTMNGFSDMEKITGGAQLMALLWYYAEAVNMFLRSTDVFEAEDSIKLTSLNTEVQDLVNKMSNDLLRKFMP